MRFSFVFALIFKNLTFLPYTSILTKNLFLVTLKAKYKNYPNKVKKFHMFQVMKIFQVGFCALFHFKINFSGFCLPDFVGVTSWMLLPLLWLAGGYPCSNNKLNKTKQV